MTDLKVGDNVRLSMEGKVTYVDSYDGETTVENAEGVEVTFMPERDGVEVEKIPDPFKAGDILRHKSAADSVYTLLADDGEGRFFYFSHHFGKAYPAAETFSPESYERVAEVAA
jgi:hypothetical protein